ncbi:UNVERIFIED_CONTAM: hypothetical protein GTU68_001073 [Idotea baltica]|nr:hypothetical protein [Idotea baltica]
MNPQNPNPDQDPSRRAKESRGVEVGQGFDTKVALLLSQLSELDNLAVAFSGGVDSTVLLHAGREALGSACVGVIADSPSLPREELEEARQLARIMGVELVEVQTEELQDPRYVANSGDRCFFCKSALFEQMSLWCLQRGFANVAFGEITDDLKDDRPGAVAAANFGVLAPLREAGFSKADVRQYATKVGLPVADKPASACLASRVPVGTHVTRELLQTIEEAERQLHRAGYSVLRVRHHGKRALLEIGESEFARAHSERDRLRDLLAPLGFESMELGVYLPPAERPQGN